MNTAETQATTTTAIVDKSTTNTTTVKLDTPIVRPSGQTIAEVVLRKPLAGALKNIAVADLLSCKYEAVATLLPRVTTPMLHKQDVESMDPADFFKLGSEVVGFLLSKEHKDSLPV